MDSFFNLLLELRRKGASDLHIYPGEPCFCRNNGRLEKLSGVSLPEEAVKKLILKTSTSRAREILGKARQVTYAFSAPDIGRFRFSVSFDREKFAVSIRFLQSQPLSLEEVGLPEPLRRVISQGAGLIIVGSPSGHGKTTTIAAILDFINKHFEKSIITIENPVEMSFTDDKSAFIQRSIPLDVGNFFEGLAEAYRLDPDVVMTDSINYRDALDQALFLCESGRMVIGATDGGSSQQILERLLFSRPQQDREGLLGKLATHLALIISQRLVPSIEVGRVAVLDILVNTGQVKTLIRNENLVMLRTLQEQDHQAGMQTFDQHLASLVRKNKVDRKVALEFADDPNEMANRFGRR